MMTVVSINWRPDSLPAKPCGINKEEPCGMYLIVVLEPTDPLMDRVAEVIDFLCLSYRYVRIMEEYHGCIQGSTLCELRRVVAR